MATLATMLTITTYGTWLRGDVRGWVEDGILFPPNPALEHLDRERMNHPPFLFAQKDWLGVGEAMGRSLIERLDLRIYAMTIQTWHTHIVFGATWHHVADVVKCVKDAARWHLRVDQPIWGVGYDKRWCFNRFAVGTRVDYVERHNLQNKWVRRPWEFIEDYGLYMR